MTLDVGQTVPMSAYLSELETKKPYARGATLRGCPQLAEAEMWASKGKSGYDLSGHCSCGAASKSLPSPKSE
jgi:hypothetical protein